MKKKEPIDKYIDKYMSLKGIKKYTDLLVCIGKRLDNVKDPYQFAYNEKSNFSKMLKGERPLKYEYIIPLEEIFGVPLAKILHEDKYFPTFNKEDIPYIYSFRYYAYKDEYKLYKRLDEARVENTMYPYEQSDEFDHFFIDYLIEYHSYNGFKFLANEHRFRTNKLNLNTYLIEEKQMMPYQKNYDELAKTIIGFDDVDLYNKIYGDCYYLLHYFNQYMSTVFCNRQCYPENVFAESILNTENIFKTVFEEKDFKYDDFNSHVYPMSGERLDIHLLNPLINICLDVALRKLDKYKSKAIDILEFGIKYNSKLIERIKKENKERCYTQTYGAVYSYHELYSSMVIIDKNIEINDLEVGKLVKKLPILK